MTDSAGTFDAYLLAYFANGLEEDSEQVRFAVSGIRAPEKWVALNNGAPVLTSSVGERGVRDPLLVRDEATGRFAILATDLRTWPDGDWERATHRGSRGLVVWTSENLVDWSDAALVEVAPVSAGNAWAPKAAWDEEAQTWRIFFASVLHDDPEHAEPSWQRILMTNTTDFAHFSPASVYLDLGRDVIDMAFIRWGDEWLRFSAQAASSPEVGSRSFITVEQGSDLLGEFRVIGTDVGAGHLERGEGPAVFHEIDGDRVFLLIDEFELRGYQLFSSSDPANSGWAWHPNAALPDGARHGSVVPITADERTRLFEAYPPATKPRQ